MLNYEDFPLSKVQQVNWLLLAVFTLAAALTFSRELAAGVLVGGLIANISFAVLKRDLTRIFQGPVEAVKLRLFIKYYLRLSVLAVLLYFVVRHWHINVFGLLFGLSTVVTSILVVGVGQYRKDIVAIQVK